MKPNEEWISSICEVNSSGYIYFESELILSTQVVRQFWSLISPPGFQMLYSVKANPNPFLLNCLRPLVDGFDVSSRAEAHLLLRSGVKANELTWSGPAKTDLAVQELIEAQIGCVHVDSLDELKALITIEKKLSKKVKKAIRLQLSQSSNRKLGFSKAELLELKNFKDIPLSGLHCYLGRESFNSENLQNFVDYAHEIKTQLNISTDFKLYLGPGLPSRPIIESEFLSQSWNIRTDAPIHFECGRAVTQSAGFYFTKILAVKKGEGNLRIIVDGGLQHTASHLKSPQFVRQGLEVLFYRNGQKLEVGKQQAIMHGSLSVWNDTLLDEVLVPDDLQRGDTIVFNQCGAYGFSAALNQFIGPTPIQEWLVTKEGKVVNISAKNLKVYQDEM